MASGFYPLSRTAGGGKALAEISERLRKLIATSGDIYGNAPESLPVIWDGNTPEDAASDGGYETYLDLALELIERCLEKPQA